MIHPAGPFLFRRCRPAQGTAFQTALPPAAPLRPWGGVGWGGLVEDVPPRGLLRAPGRGQLALAPVFGPRPWQARDSAASPERGALPQFPRRFPSASLLLSLPGMRSFGSSSRAPAGSTRPQSRMRVAFTHVCTRTCCVHTRSLVHVYARPCGLPAPGAGERVPRIVLPQRARSPAGSRTAPGAGATSEWILLSSMWGGSGGAGPELHFSDLSEARLSGHRAR